MRDSMNVSHAFDLVSMQDNVETLSKSAYFAEKEEDDVAAIDTFGTLGSAGTFGGCFGCFGTAGCCC